MFKSGSLYLLLVLFTLSITSQAQNRRRTAKPKVAEVKVETPDPADVLYESMLSSTARILFVDSVVTDKKDFLNKIPLNSESGRIGGYDALLGTSGNASSYAYINEFGNKMYFSRSEKNGHSRLYSSDKLNGQWTNNMLITDFGDDFEDINYPFMMSDGVTLYFSAKSKNGLGGYDIYVTMYDADSARFYKPENIGLPYNSKANDYYCIIDEFDEIGWLVTDRNQPDGKVCIYTFVPSSLRDVYDENIEGEAKVRSLAEIRSIRDTWKDNVALNAARQRLQRLMTRNGEGYVTDMAFVVNDNTVYTGPDDFKSATNRERFAKLCAMKKDCSEMEQRLESYRYQYSFGTAEMKRKLAGQIKSLEQQLEKLCLSVSVLEKDIRNTENIMKAKQ